jgi:hypothetical protein
MYTDPFAAEESSCKKDRRMEQDMMRDMYWDEKSMKRDKDCGEMPSNLPLGISYVPMQIFRKLYEPAVGLERGTLFQELDLPYIGEGAKK